MTTCIALLWPLVQLALVFGAHTSPWRLMGFGMYATAHEIRVTLRRHREEGPPRDVDPGDLPKPARDAYDAFVTRRSVLGRLCSPEAFVATWRRADPTVGRVDVEVDVLRLKGGRMAAVATDRSTL